MKIGKEVTVDESNRDIQTEEVKKKNSVSEKIPEQIIKHPIYKHLEVDKVVTNSHEQMVSIPFCFLLL